MHLRFLTTLLLAGTLSASGQNATELRIKQVENSLAPGVVYGDTIPRLNLEARMKETGVKGLSIAVIKDYKIDWAKGYGWADEASGRKVTTNTRFQAASISKSINSLGILLLVQQGKLDPEADINVYLKRWKFPYDSIAKGKKINIYHLLSHTAGLDIHGFPGYKNTDAIPTVVQILNGHVPANTRAVRSLFEPGLKFKYSGGGTTISQLILEDVTGKAYADFMQENVLKPLEMTNSSYLQPPLSSAELATGYYASNGEPVKGLYHLYPEQAAAGLWTTPSDLAKYIIECQLALEGKSKRVLSTEMMQKRMTPYTDAAAALGVFIDKRGNNQYFNHNGGNEAFLSTSYGSLSGGNGVVIMINSDNFAVVDELLNSVAQVYQWKDFYRPQFKKIVKLSADSLEAYTGNYLLNHDTISIKRRGNELFIYQNGQPADGYEMIFMDQSRFAIREVPGAEFKVLRDASLWVDALELRQGGAVFRLPRVLSR